MSKCRKHRVNDVNHYTHKTPDTRCTCEGSGGSDRGAGRGPATDPALMGKSTAVDHPQTPPATGPAVGLTDEGKLQHPQTPEATGPAR